MPWVRIDEQFPDHPKVVEAGPLGIALQVAALCYCNRHLTDGFVPASAARRLVDLDGLGSADEVIGRLVKVGMWQEVDGGFLIHDFDDYQPSRAEVQAQRRKVAGRVARHRARKAGNAVTNSVTNAVGNKKGSALRGGPDGVAGTRDDPGTEPATLEVAQSPQTQTSNRVGNAVTNGGVTPAPVPVPPRATTGDPEAETSGLPTVAAQTAARLESQDTIDVFEAWKATLPPGSRPRLTDARRNAVRAALKRYERQDVLDAAQGWVNDPWPERAQHNDLAQLLHMGSKRKPLNVLEKMRALYRRGPPPPAMGRRTAEMARNAVGLHELVGRQEGGGGDDDRRVGAAGAAAQRELPGPAG